MWNEISGASRSLSARPTRDRRWVAALARPSNVAARSVSEPITLTYTLAWRRSRVTSTPVTVTSPVMRGSLASSARNVATSSRMASATRSARRFSFAMADSGRCRGLERPRYLFGAVALDHIADLDVVEVLHADTALEALADLPHVVLEPLERRDGAIENLDSVADDTHAPLAIDHAAADRAAGDRTDARDLEDFAHLRFAQHHLALLGTEHAFHRGTHVGDSFIDDPVQLDLHTFALR